MGSLSLIAYKMGSESSKLLSKEFGIKRIKHKGSKFKGKVGKTVINWGMSSLPEEVKKCKVVNSEDSVAKASNKLTTFEALAEFSVMPEFTTDMEVAKGWVGEGITIVERHKLSGHSGAGIRIVEKYGEVTKAPLYVKYIPKKNEYRVHVCGDKVFLVQRKARNKEIPDDKVNWKVRNHDNGFIFERDIDGEIPERVLSAARIAVDCLGLDFGAADVVYNGKNNKAYVLEVNTAPGLAGTTVQDYKKALTELVS